MGNKSKKDKKDKHRMVNIKHHGETTSLTKKHYRPDGKKSPKVEVLSKDDRQTPLTSCQAIAAAGGLPPCSNQNITLAQKIVDLFTVGTEDSINSLINHLSSDVVLEVHDQTGLIPYGGNYLGRKGLTEFFHRYSDHIVTIDSYRGETSTNCEQTKVTLTVDTTQLHRIPAAREEDEKNGKFCHKHIFVMSFNNLGDVVRIDLFHETGPLVLFYSQN